MAMMQIIPSWAIEGDVLIFTSHPELTKKVIDQVAAGQHDSMVSDPQYAALLNAVPSDACAIGLADSKTGARQLMQMLQRFWPMITMGMMNEGVQVPSMLPSIETYNEQMEPGFRYVRKTADGWNGIIRVPAWKPVPARCGGRRNGTCDFDAGAQ
jgi:hypothetical protein